MGAEHVHVMCMACQVLEGGTTLSFFAAYAEMPAEPHACLTCHRSDKHALLLTSVRLDGQVRGPPKLWVAQELQQFLELGEFGSHPFGGRFGRNNS